MRIKDTSLRQQRDRALFEAYTKALREIHFDSEKDAIDYIRTHEAPRFYIDGEFCSQVIARMMKGAPMKLKGPLRIKKFEDLYRLFLEERSKPENEGLSVLEISMTIVKMPAPEFYLGPRAASGIIAEQRRLRLAEMDRWIR